MHFQAMLKRSLELLNMNAGSLNELGVKWDKTSLRKRADELKVSATYYLQVTIQVLID